MHYKRDAAKELAEEKDYDDPRDEWLICPECGDSDAIIVSGGFEAIAACPSCGYNTEIYGE